MGIFVCCFLPAVGKSLGKEWVSAIGDLVSLALVATMEAPVDAIKAPTQQTMGMIGGFIL